MSGRKDHSGFLPDDDIDAWFLYKKSFRDGFNNLLGNEVYLTIHGDLPHVLGEVIEFFREIRFNRDKMFAESAMPWHTFVVDPYCFTIWGRLMDNLDDFRLYYIATMDPETADIIIYSCWPSERFHHYQVYKWRGELPNKHGDLRKYRNSKWNYKNEYFIPPCWPSWENVELERHGLKSTFRKI